MRCLLCDSLIAKLPREWEVLPPRRRLTLTERRVRERCGDLLFCHLADVRIVGQKALLQMQLCCACGRGCGVVAVAVAIAVAVVLWSWRVLLDGGEVASGSGRRDCCGNTAGCFANGDSDINIGKSREGAKRNCVLRCCMSEV